MTPDDAWIDVGPAEAFRSNRGRRVEVGGVFLAVWRTKDRWFAFDDACPHMGASLADGLVIGDTIQCPWHEWRYHMETGVCPVRPWAKVRVHPVRVEQDRVLVRRPEPFPKGKEPDPGDEEWMTWEVDRYFKRNSGDGSDES